MSMPWSKVWMFSEKFVSLSTGYLKSEVGWLGFMASQLLLVISCQIQLVHTHTHTHTHIYIYIYIICKRKRLQRTLLINELELICFHAVKFFQVLLFIVCTQLKGFKYCFLTLTILFNSYVIWTTSTQLYGFKQLTEIILSKWLNSSIWSTDEILTGTTTPGQSGFGSNGVVYHSHNHINHNCNTIHIQMQADSVVSGTNAFINFWLRSMVTQGERHNS